MKHPKAETLVCCTTSAYALGCSVGKLQAVSWPLVEIRLHMQPHIRLP